jgi:hypothetical protein
MFSRNDPKEILALQRKFDVEILTAVGQRLRAKLTRPMMLHCKMPVGAQLSTIPFVGDEQFFALSAWDKKEELHLRLAPVVRSEWRYTDVALTELRQNFTFELRGGSGLICSGRHYDEVMEAILGEREPKSGRTYRELVNAALEHQRRELVAQQLSSHKDFGSW